MAEKARFFDSVAGDRIYSSTDWADIFAAFVTDGYLVDEGDMFSTTEDSPADMSVNVGTGIAWIQGREYENTAELDLTIAANASGNPRIDRVVIRLHFGNRTINTVIKQGTPAGSPAAPTLTRDGTMWELSIAKVAVANGAASIVNANITMERDDVLVMGVAAGPKIRTQAEPMTTTQRDALSGANLFAGRLIFNTTTARTELYTGAAWVATYVAADVQVFTASGTWTKPAGAKLVLVECFGSGGGGGGGGSATTNGGAGGGGGACTRKWYDPANLSATEAVTVGAGGTGGAATSGGVSGNSSSFKDCVGYPGRLGSSGTGAGGGGGGTGSDGSGGTGGGPAPTATGLTPASTFAVGGGGAGGGTQGVNDAGCAEFGGGGGAGGGDSTSTIGIGGGSMNGGGGGGAGRGSNATAAATAGGGSGYSRGGGGAGGVGTTGAAGSAGGRQQGGGGGAHNTGGVGGAGGAGGVAGGGGGGGGRGSTTGGVGGNGGRGEVRVITFF